MSDWAQADIRSADVQDGGLERTLQPFRRLDRVSDQRQTFLHAISGLGLGDRVPDARTV